MVRLHKLFEPIKVGSMELKNRVVMAAAETNAADGEWVGEQVKRFYQERAQGGVALIILRLMPTTNTHPGWGPLNLGIHSDAFVPGLRELVEVVHSSGARIAAQPAVAGLPPEREGGPIRLSSAGGSWQADRVPPVELIGPSHVPVSSTRGRERQRPLTLAEIEEIIACTAEAARRAREAGFDAIDLRCGVGSLISQFISPLTNKRTDKYGGDLEDRMRFPLELVAAIKGKVGDNCPVLCRISGDDFVQGGHTLQDNQRVAAIFEAGGIAAIHVAGGWFTAGRPVFQMSVPRGDLAYLAEGIRKTVSIPVMAGNRINDPLVAERIIAEGKADMVAVVRPLIADPEFVNKARDGRLDDIRKCIACCRCFDMALSGSTIECTVNPRAARELEYTVEPAQKPKRVFVIGGGPAGMEAARVAAIRGHNVTLLEKEDRLGGHLLEASAAPYKEEIRDLLAHLVLQVEKAGVTVRTGEKAGAGIIEEENPDAVVVATGATSIIPDIPGVGRDNVIAATDVLAGNKSPAGTVIIVGGGMIGCEAAEFLAGKGKKVTIIEMLPRIATDLTPSDRWVVKRRLREAGVGMETEAKVVGIEEGGVRIDRGGRSEFFQGDSIVLAVGLKADRELAETLKGRVSELHLAGDCAEARLIGDALREGFFAARLI